MDAHHWISIKKQQRQKKIKKNQISLSKRMETMHMLYNGTPPKQVLAFVQPITKQVFQLIFSGALMLDVAAREQWQEMSIDAAVILLHT